MEQSLPETVRQEFSLKTPNIPFETISDMRVGIKSGTHERFLRIVTNDGRIFIKTIALNGVVFTEHIEIPVFVTREQRDKIIVYLKKEKNFIQDDIADYMGISQSTVSNVLRSRN